MVFDNELPVCDMCLGEGYHTPLCPLNTGWEDDSPYTTDDMELDTDADFVFDFEEELEG